VSKFEISEVNIVETEKVELKEPLVILGFVGAGLVGGVAVTHLTDKMKMKKIAHIRSRYLPSAVVFIDGKLRQPFRIYSNDKGDLCAIVCEVPLHSEGHYPIASALLDWAEDKGAKEIVVLEGIAVRSIPKKRKSFCVAEYEKCKEYEEKGVRLLSAGIIHGIAGSILNECLTRQITGVTFMTPSVAFMPDPGGAAVLIETLNNVYGFKISTTELVKDREEITQKLKEIAEDHQKMVKAEEKRGAPERLYI
jgi:uncharacterized protein